MPLVRGTHNEHGRNVQTAQLPLTCITSPLNGALVTGSSVTLQWRSTSAVTSYFIQAGSTPGGSNYFNANVGTATSQLIGGLPGAGTLYVKLWTNAGNRWSAVEASYPLGARSADPAPEEAPATGERAPDDAATGTPMVQAFTRGRRRRWTGRQHATSIRSHVAALSAVAR